MSLQSERLLNHMLRLRLSHLPNCYEAIAEEASAKNLPYLDFLEQSLEAESQAKHSRNVRLKTQWAHFPYNKGLDQFDFAFQPSVDERKLRELASLAFLERKENVLLLGPPGVGKTHLAIALGTEAIVAGSSVYFVTIQDLVAQFQRARDENKLKERMSLLVKPKLLLGHPRPAAAPLHHHQHQGRKLPAQGQEKGRCRRRKAAGERRSIAPGSSARENAAPGFALRRVLPHHLNPPLPGEFSSAEKWGFLS
jgi:hypothetical protein